MIDRPWDSTWCLWWRLRLGWDVRCGEARGEIVGSVTAQVAIRVTTMPRCHPTLRHGASEAVLSTWVPDSQHALVRRLEANLHANELPSG